MGPARVGRRAVARGVAWTAPVVVMAATAPAFAVSCDTLSVATTITGPVEAPNSGTKYRGPRTLTFEATFQVCGSDTIPAGTTFDIELTPESYWTNVALTATSLPAGVYSPALGVTRSTASYTPSFRWGGPGCMPGEPDVRFGSTWSFTSDYRPVVGASCVNFTATFQASLFYNAKASSTRQNNYYSPDGLRVRTFSRITAGGCSTVTDRQGTRFFTLDINGTRPGC